ncbi:hypothetical protein E2F46_07400 [Luteimonas aestuarii]|uniref:Uncharacterized protein n=1 Tax=Luteimonas aestuarii TaxID=453837 RepID=A0A4R5TV87_9GAMM|nr:hypothetical protein [Luteimonas aestuarii]TDK24991.1 hypothetical protein E2F46_07400 [Luteimonas aestuarii]
MKTFLRSAIATVSVAALAACTSSHQLATAPGPAAQPALDGHYQGDVRYIAAVEHIARKRGVQVRWVNPPVRRVDQ